jgi:hypothetical protein
MSELPEIVLERIEMSFNSIFDTVEPDRQSLALLMLGWGYSDAALLNPEFKKFHELASLFCVQVYRPRRLCSRISSRMSSTDES